MRTLVNNSPFVLAGKQKPLHIFTTKGTYFRELAHRWWRIWNPRTRCHNHSWVGDTEVRDNVTGAPGWPSGSYNCSRPFQLEPQRKWSHYQRRCPKQKEMLWPLSSSQPWRLFSKRLGVREGRRIVWEQTQPEEHRPPKAALQGWEWSRTKASSSIIAY